MIPKGLLPVDLESDAFIAGGYAACPALAGDIDIWVCVEGEELSTVRKRILRFLGRGPNPYDEETESVLAEGGYSGGEGGLIQLRTTKVARVYLSWTSAHIMVTNGSVEDVLASFDLSTHQVALMPDGRVVRGEKWSSIADWPMLVRPNDKTGARRQKMIDRYHPAGTDPLANWQQKQNYRHQQQMLDAAHTPDEATL